MSLKLVTTVYTFLLIAHHKGKNLIQPFIMAIYIDFCCSLLTATIWVYGGVRAGADI